MHIVAGVDPRHGGPSYSVPRLCSALAESNARVSVLTVNGANMLQNPLITAYNHDFAGVPMLRALRLSSELARAVRIKAHTSDIVHVHGLWLMPNVYAGRAAAAFGRPLIVTPRGMLAPEALAFSARKKRLFWCVLQRPAYAHAAVWHATSEVEAEEIRAFGVRAPIAIIPNGIDISDIPESSLPRQAATRTILYLGRLHPIKDLPDLIAAWTRLAPERPDWYLHIFGPDEGRQRAELEAMAVQLGTQRIVFGGPVYGDEKVNLFHKADLFVLPTRHENFGISVAEALAAGVPAIVSHGAPWSGLERERCGWWVERGVEPLLTALRAATALPDGERCTMGLRGHAWMQREFSWDHIARQMLDVYAWIIGQSDPPPCVHFS